MHASRTHDGLSAVDVFYAGVVMNRHLPLYWHALALFLTWLVVQHLDSRAFESEKAQERRAWGYMRAMCARHQSEPVIDLDGRFICQRPNGARIGDVK